MRKSLTYKILAAVLALSAANWAVPADVLAGEDANGNYNVTYDGETISDSYKNVYGNGHNFTINGGTINGSVFGVGNSNYDKDASGGNVTISGGTIGSVVMPTYVYGGYAKNGSANNNIVNISGNADVTGYVYGGYSDSTSQSISGEAYDNTVNISDGSVEGYVYGGYTNNGEAHDNTVNISGGFVSNVVGGESENGTVHHNTVNIKGGTVSDKVYGSWTNNGEANNNTVNIEGGSVTDNVFGGWSRSSANDNEIIISCSANITMANLYGRSNYGTGTGNTLTIDGWTGNNGTGDYTVNSLNNFDIIEFKNIKANTGLTAKSVNGMNDTQLILSSVDVTNLSNATKHIFGTITLTENITNVIKDFTNNIDANALNGWNFNDNETSGIYAGYIANATAITNNNTITITGNVENSVLTGKFIDENGNEHYKGSRTPDDTTDDSTTLTIGNGFDTKVATVAGVYAEDKTDGTAQNAEKGVVNISGDNITYDGIVYAGYSESGSANSNTIYVAAGTNAKNMTLKGYNSDSNADGNAASIHSGNTLNITGNGSTFESIENFDTINFKNVKLNSNNVLTTLQSANLTDTTLNVESLASGETFKAGDTVTLIAGNIEGTPTLTHDKVTAGLSQDLSVEEITNNSSVKLSVKDVSLNSQIDLVAENRAVAAAFVNQGTDLISDSLDVLSRDSNYGVKTFAAVHGNRSKYDVNSDIKINGWSTIVGIGNAGKFDNGSEFSWGVFYENGSGNYRTFNEFNNEFFRGDGSLVYNGGGIAARYTNKNGVYTEGSLRAGMLKSDMDNALRDGAGNFYGYESESAYYGAHIGIGKIISLSESSDLDVYGKFFHTYTEGDSFKVANDEFEFDSINSDRLRIGARITSNKENKFSTYYGLAYEYEFNGDADMTAQGLKAPTQSLQGSSVMAEIGFNYQPTPTSPWSFDLNMRGYAGERQGGSFNVQATYTF